MPAMDGAGGLPRSAQVPVKVSVFLFFGLTIGWSIFSCDKHLLPPSNDH